MRVLSLIIVMVVCFSASAQLKTRYELSEFTETATYEEAMAFYRALADEYEAVTISEHGLTDIGLPLHVVLINTGDEKTPADLQQSGKAVWLINNAIHPGEPDGVSASQMFARNLVENKKKYRKALDKVAIAIIPFYNLGGVLNRNSTTRVNQNGPDEYGFRGNARHYDLNRDFIKSDTRNAQSFMEIFQLYDPDLFLDTHVSNGSDYQHVMTLVNSQKDKMGGALGKYIQEVFLPDSFEGMKERGFDAVPYVNAWGQTPDKGWTQFIDWPRYSTGYAALFHTMGHMSETHMLKSFKSRVESTYALMETMLTFLDEKGEELIKLREATKRSISNQKEFEISWTVDTSRHSMIEFSGYEPTYVASEISGLMRLKYDRTMPFTKEVPFKDHYVANKVITAPEFYLIPQQWRRVLKRLELNQIEMTRLQNDSTILVEAYMIEDYQTARNAYEGHYRHYGVKVAPKEMQLKFRKGDYLVPVNQWRNRYIVETLEPEAPDSFFAWNFFDAILQQKEHFSSYVFEDHALQILKEHPEIKQSLEAAKQENPTLAESANAQLEFIYRRSDHWEPEYLRYPIFRVME
ncbi:MAG: M14 family zinc carboxypeptidase [Cytophagales bacterium]|nr:M14 family zinc carboxypeptidase [Cytophagales bacterium]